LSKGTSQTRHPSLTEYSALKEAQRMQHTYFFYILKCSDGSFYVGSTTNLENRIKTHNQGEAAPHTAKRRPGQLVYQEEFKRLDDAVKRERQIKKWSREKKEALIRGEMEKLKKLSKSHRSYYSRADRVDGLPTDKR
jgi:putative endonuclease